MKTRIHILLFAALSLVAADAAKAGFCYLGFPPTKPPVPTVSGPCCDPCDACKGSPNYVATGNYTTSATDLQIPTSGFPLVVSRVYESGDLVDGPLGIGWTLNLSARLVHGSYLLASPSTFRTEARVTLPEGIRLKFLENVDGSFTATENRFETLVRNGNGSFTLSTRDKSATYLFASTGELQTISDEFGNALNFTYDGTGRLQRVADGAGSGRYLDIFYGANGRISHITDHSSRTLQFAYATSGVLESITDPAGRITTYEYTTKRFAPLLTRVADHWNRTVASATYDHLGRTSTYMEQGETYTYSYEYNGQSDQSSKVDSTGLLRWVYTYATDGVVTERVFPLPGSQQTVYNTDRTVAEVTDELGVKTAYTYLSGGRVGSVTKAAGTAQAIRFDYAYDSTFPYKVTSVLPKNPGTGAYQPHWQGWKYEYYAPGSTAPGALWKVLRVRSDGTTTDLVATYEYNIRGQVTAVTDAAEARTDYAYDTATNLQTVTAPSNNDGGVRPITQYGYDAVGRVTSVTDPLGKVTTYTYDGLDRILTVTLPKPSTSSPLNFITTYSYDNWEAATQLVSVNVTDPNGIVTKQQYDAYGRLVRSIDGLSNVTTYGYTPNLLTSITDGNNNTTSYTYDELGRLKLTTFPDGTNEPYTYFADGLLESKSNRTATTYFEYDFLKRLTKRRDAFGTGITYTYEGQKLTQVVDTFASPAETHTFSYDGSYRMTSVTQGPRGTITYTHDAADRPATYTVSGGPSATYAYYPDGSLNTINWSPVTGQFKYAYTLGGQNQTITMPNNQTRGYSYDDQGRVLQLANTHPTAGNLATYNYAYDLNHVTATYNRLGQRVTMTADVPSQSWTGAVTKYAYDANYQLTRVEYPNVTPFAGEIHQWTHDAIGNRLTSTVNSTTTNYTYQKIGANPLNWQRLLSDGTSTYTYDTAGNAQPSGYNFAFDRENRLKNMNVFPSQTPFVTYKYDYQGRRTSKAMAANTTYLYDGLNLIRETTSASNDYLFGPGIDEPVAMMSGGAASYFVVDGLGSVSALNDSVGATQNKYAYDAWGVDRSSTEQFGQPFRYTSREVGDSPTPVGSFSPQWFYRARYYTPRTGRFLSEDPIGFLGGPSLYGYARNTPIRYRDPLGLYTPSPLSRDCPCGERAMMAAAIYQRFPDAKVAAAVATMAQEIASAAAKIGAAVGGGEGGPGDAMRHCYWQCETAKRFGASLADELGIIHENCRVNPPLLRSMDFQNNAVGRSLASATGDCLSNCQQALLNKQLTVRNP